jgi:hypothetical protein
MQSCLLIPCGSRVRTGRIFYLVFTLFVRDFTSKDNCKITLFSIHFLKSCDCFWIVRFELLRESNAHSIFTSSSQMLISAINHCFRLISLVRLINFTEHDSCCLPCEKASVQIFQLLPFVLLEKCLIAFLKNTQNVPLKNSK